MPQLAPTGSLEPWTGAKKIWIFHSEQDKQKVYSVSKFCFLKGLQMFSVGSFSNGYMHKINFKKRWTCSIWRVRLRRPQILFKFRQKFAVPVWARAADFPEHWKKEKKNTLLFLPRLRLMKLSLPSYWSAFIVRILMYHTAVARIFQRCFWKRFNFFLL